MKPGYIEKLPGLLKQFSDFMGNRKWFASDKVDNYTQDTFLCCGLIILKFDKFFFFTCHL